MGIFVNNKLILHKKIQLVISEFLNINLHDKTKYIC